MLSIQRVFLLLALAVCSLVSLPENSSVAQDIPALKENQSSVILFDLRIDKFAEDAKKYNGSEALAGLPIGAFKDIKLTDLKRVFGSASLPENLESAMKNMMGPPKDQKIGGKEFFVPKFGAKFALGHRVDQNTFEIGTQAYCLQEKRDFYTDQLKTALNTAPDDPIRVVIDLETRADFIKEAIDLGKQQLDNPVTEAYLDLVDNAKSLVFTQSLASNNLATLMIEGVNETDAKDLRDGLESLLGSAKLGAPTLIGQLKNQMKISDKSGAALKTMVDDLEATIEGTSISVILKKPEGLEEAVGEIQTAIQVQAKAVSKRNFFRQVGLSALNYESANREFPYGEVKGYHNDLSWRVKVLPYLEQNQIFDQLKTDKGPEDEANAKFVSEMPECFGPDGKNAGVSWIQSGVKGFADITDGSSNTIMLIENPNAGPWLKNTPFTAEEAIQLVSNLKDGQELVVVLYDCSTHTIDNSIDKETLKNLLDPADGNVVQNW